MSSTINDSELTRLLQDADPLAHDSGFGTTERMEMRRLILSQVAAKAQSPWRQLSPVLSVALLLALALAIAWWPRAAGSPTASSSLHGRGAATATPGPTPGVQEAGTALESRKIQFETPGGTLVVWVLNPNFPS